MHQSSLKRVLGFVDTHLAGAVDWPEVDVLVHRSWSMTAPKRLAATLP